MSEDSLILTEISHALAEMSKMDEAMLSTAKETRKSGTVDTVLESMGSLGEMVKVVKNIGSFTELLKMSGLGMLVKILSRIAEPIDEALSDMEDELFQPLEDLGDAIAKLIYDQAPQIIDLVHSYLVPLVQKAVTWIETEGAKFIQDFLEKSLPKIAGAIDTLVLWFSENGPELLANIVDLVNWVLSIKNMLEMEFPSAKIGDVEIPLYVPRWEIKKGGQ